MNDILGQTLSAYLDGYRYIVNEGGTRSRKTFCNLEALFHIANTQPNLLISVCSQTMPHLKKGAIRDFHIKLIELNMFNPKNWNKSDKQYNFKTGSVIEFFSLDSPDKVHGPGRDILFVNEAQSRTITYEIVRHLLVRTSKAAFFDFNPVSSFWIHKELKNDPKCRWIHSTYKDNPYLSPQQIEEIERNKINKEWWRVYGEGLVGSLDNLVYPDITLVDFMPLTKGVDVYGLDFGFNDPAVLVHVKIIDNTVYLDECFYRSGLNTAELIANIKVFCKPNYDEIFADSSGKISIADIRAAGLNCKPVIKPRDKFEMIQKVKNYKIFVTKRSLNAIKEAENYYWIKDANEKITNKPSDGFDHFWDAVGYAIIMKAGRQNQGGGMLRTF